MNYKNYKKIASLCLALLVCACTALPLIACADPYADIAYVETPYAGTTLYVYNWGENIANGEDGSLNLERIFEKKYNINVEYTTYPSNEEMYAKLTSGTVHYDLIIPSDYMIARLIEEDRLQKLDYSQIPNYANIQSQYRTNQYYDCAGTDGAAEYTVPYTVGMIGIVYNTQLVAEKDVEAQSWSLMWNEAYKGKLINFNNSRDAFAVAMFYNGIDVNTTDRTDWETAYTSLAAQKPLLKGYYMDEIYNQMEGGNAAAAIYYAGDCLSMIGNNEDLAFYYPIEGTNTFVDAMCIPKDAQNVGAAHLFINFLLEEEYAVENSLYTCYASPNQKVIDSAYYRESLGEDNYKILYDLPAQYKNQDGSLNTDICQSYDNLDQETKNILNELWNKLK